MKTFRMIGCLLAAVCMCLGMVSCGDDDDDDVVGHWYMRETDADNKKYGALYDEAYHFVSKNTVIWYSWVYYRNEYPDHDDFHKLTGSMSNYYAFDGRTYTYTIQEGKIYIPNKGEILTITQNGLCKEGSSVVLNIRK